MKPIKYGASWKSNALQTGGTAVEVFSGISNSRGAVVWLASLFSHGVSGWSNPVLIAKAGVPVSVVDGDVLLSGPLKLMAASTYTSYEKLEQAVFIPAGRGFILSI